MRKYRLQEAPYCVTPELTEGCNLQCSFCGLNGIRKEGPDRNYKFMTKKTMESLMSQMAELGWNSRIEFAMRGEPTMNPDFIELVAIAHKHRPKAHKLMISNGGGLLGGKGPKYNIPALFDAGINVLALDNYHHARLVPKILERIGIMPSGGDHPLGFKYFDYPEDISGNPHQRRPPGTKMLVIIQDISDQAKAGNHGHLYNYAGCGFPKNNDRAGQRCHQPFRQLAVRYDGTVAICCNDWRGVYKCGSVVKDGVAAVWQGAALGAAREYLIRGDRDALQPCAGCDHRTFRPGLLPDKLGKATMHKPDKQTRADADAAIAGKPWATVVKRSWEV